MTHTPWRTGRTLVGGNNANCIAIYSGDVMDGSAKLVAFVTPSIACKPHCSVCHGLELHPESDANAQLIVTAGNSHDGLLGALEQAALELEEASKILQPLRPGCADIFETAAEQKRAAIKAARP